MGAVCGRTADPSGLATAAMSASMAGRGAQERVYADRRTGISLAAREVAPIAGAGAPLHSNERGTVWAALDGHIANYRALRTRLAERGHRFATDDHAEALVHLYEEYGEALAHALDGAFACVVWDAPAERLLLVRDRFGQRPLFYANAATGLAFASEARALSQGVASQPPIDRSAVRNWLTHGYLADARSIFAGVRQLPAAHVASLARGAAEPLVSRYWDPPFAEVDAAESSRELAEEAGRLLQQSVAGSLLERSVAGAPRAAVPVGRGVGAQLAAVLAARVCASPIVIASVDYGAPDRARTRAAELLARALGAEHRGVVVTDDAVARSVPAVLSSLDQPLADRTLITRHAVATCIGSDVGVIVGDEGAADFFGADRDARHEGRATADRDRRAKTERLRYGLLAAAEGANRQAGLEPRAPYLQRELVELGAGVAPRVHWADGGGTLLRLAERDLASDRRIPALAAESPAPVAQWLRGPLHGCFREQLQQGSLFEEGWVERQAAERLLEEHTAGGDRSTVLWPWLAIGLWLDGVRGLGAQ